MNYKVDYGTNQIEFTKEYEVDLINEAAKSGIAITYIAKHIRGESAYVDQRWTLTKKFQSLEIFYDEDYHFEEIFVTFTHDGGEFRCDLVTFRKYCKQYRITLQTIEILFVKPVELKINGIDIYKNVLRIAKEALNYNENNSPEIEICKYIGMKDEYLLFTNTYVVYFFKYFSTTLESKIEKRIIDFFDTNFTKKHDFRTSFKIENLVKQLKIAKAVDKRYIYIKFGQCDVKYDIKYLMQLCEIAKKLKFTHFDYSFEVIKDLNLLVFKFGEHSAIIMPVRFQELEDDTLEISIEDLGALKTPEYFKETCYFDIVESEINQLPEPKKQISAPVIESAPKKEIKALPAPVETVVESEPETISEKPQKAKKARKPKVYKLSEFCTFCRKPALILVDYVSLCKECYDELIEMDLSNLTEEELEIINEIGE